MKAATKTIEINGQPTNYSINTEGEVTNTKTGKVLKQTTNLGYKLVRLKGKNHRVHRLVAQFLENPENKPYINHKNLVKSDNRLENLEYCTARENWAHAKDFGLPTFGSEQNRELLLQPRKNKLNKGISPWKIGHNKYRVTISLNETKSRTLGYFTSFKSAVLCYLKSHIDRYNQLPKNKYVCPETQEIVFDGTAA